MFEETSTAFSTLGFSDKKQSDLFKIFAAVLHLGNIKFHEATIKTENEQDQEGVIIKVIIFSFLFRLM